MNQTPPPLLLPRITEGLQPSTFIAYLTLLSFVTFVGGVIYDGGFLNAIGLSFGQVPMTLADHTKSAVLWLPGYAVAVFLVITFEIVTRRIENGKYEDEIAAPGTRWRWFRGASNWLPPLLMAAFMAWLFLVRGEYAIIPGAAAAAMVWSQVAIWIVRHPVVGGGMDIVRRRLFYFGPIIAIMLFAVGWSDGLTALNRPAGAAALATSNGSVSIALLRVYETGVLYRRDDEVGFRRWDSIQSMSMPRRSVHWRGLWPMDAPAARPMAEESK